MEPTFRGMSLEDLPTRHNFLMTLNQPRQADRAAQGSQKDQSNTFGALLCASLAKVDIPRRTKYEANFASAFITKTAGVADIFPERTLRSSDPLQSTTNNTRTLYKMSIENMCCTNEVSSDTQLDEESCDSSS
eukprot:TRINITY_DN2538_c0_g1_i1.p1 TRINITY_DN2538_c0_g1~~TRINITY_DN2538_c0_g1_i1.p1  ORF type:complete len:133 (-),score=4.24 TRINITY_DN2538_c0_g1_i1:218-616(-)